MRRRAPRGSASRSIAFTKSIPRDKVPGGTRRGGGQSSIASRGQQAAFLSRLRRLEVVVLQISGRLRENNLQVLLDKMLELADDTKDIVDGDKGGDKTV